MNATLRKRQMMRAWSGAAVAALALFLATGCGKNEPPKRTNDGATSRVAPAAPGGTSQSDRDEVRRLAGTESPVPQPPPPPRYETLTVGAGTGVVASLQTPVSSVGSAVGQTVTLETVEPVRSGGRVVIPAGSKVRGKVTFVQKAGRVKGGAAITLRFTDLVTPDGKSYTLAAEPFRAVTKGSGKQSAAMIGGGAAAGGVLGGVLGGKDTVLPGAAIGGILGTTAAVATKGKQISLPAGQRLTVRFTEPVRVTVASR